MIQLSVQKVASLNWGMYRHCKTRLDLYQTEFLFLNSQVPQCLSRKNFCLSSTVYVSVSNIKFFLTLRSTSRLSILFHWSVNSYVSHIISFFLELIKSFYVSFFFFFAMQYVELPQPGIRPISPALEGQGVNHWIPIMFP